MTDVDRDARIAGLIAKRRAEPIRPIEQTDSADLAPLSSVQLSLWLYEALSEHDGATNRPTAARVTGKLDQASLSRAIDSLLARHEPLRTVYPLVGEEPVQQVIDAPAFEFLVTDVSELAAEAQQGAIRAAMGQASRRGSNPEEEIAFNVALLVESAESHVLIVGLSHIAFDGWSERIFWSDLLELYRAEVEAITPELPELTIGFGDYARWERGQWQGGQAEEDLAYWADALAGLDEVPPLPRTADAGGVLNLVATAFSSEEMAAVRACARTEGTTPFVVLLSAVQLLVRELCDAEDFAISCPVAGRDRPEVLDLVSCFINPLLVRSSLEGAATGRELIQATRVRVAGALAHRTIPYSEVLAQLGSANSRPTLFNVSFQWRDFPQRPAHSANPLGLEPLRVPVRRNGVDFFVTPTESGATLEVEFNQELVGVSTVSAWCERLRSQARRLCEDPDGALGPFRQALARPDPPTPLFPDRMERVRATSRPTLVPDRVSAVAQLHPDRVVLEDATRHWTATELNELATGIGAALIDRGVKPGDRVLLAAPRSALAIAAMYGCWKVGAAYVPVEPDQPTSRTQAIIDDCGPAAILTDRVAAELAGAPIVELHYGLAVAGGGASVGADADQAAYVIYTSGSTGRPKGVVVPHRAVAAFVNGAVAAYGLEPGDRVLQFHSLAFDASVEEVHVSLARGATLVLPDVGLLGSARRFLDFVQEQQLSVVSVPTAFWHEMVRQAVEAGLKIPAVLRTLIIGGEAARPAAVDAWHSLNPRTQLVNSYGPTETTVVVCAAHLEPGVAGDHVSIGRPLPGVEVDLLDPSGVAVPAGSWGELFIAGPQLALGYLGREDETAARFVNGPGSNCWYRTGDRARRRADGEIEIAGRFDDQVKIAGHRIEPGEVERVLQAQAGVLDVAVVAVEQLDGAFTLVAFVVGEHGQSPTEVAAGARQHLPTWMVPGDIRFLHELPLTAGGKVDRTILRAQANLGASPVMGPADGVAGQSDTVERLLSLWRQLLELDEIGVDADFFELGGRSLTAVRLSHLIETEFDVSLPVVSIFGAPTVAELSAVIDEELGVSRPVMPAPVATDAVAVPVMPGEWPLSPVRLYLDRAPLSFSQQRIWLHQELRDERSGYMIRAAYRLRGPLDTEALSAAVREVVAANEILRTRIVAGLDGRPSQHVDPVGTQGGSKLVTVHDLGELDPRQRLDQASQLQEEFVRPGFDLAVDHPFRVLIVAVGPTEHLFTLVVHHVAVDGEGLSLLLQQITDSYASPGEPADESDHATTLQFADFAVWQRARLADGAEDHALEHWRKALAGIDGSLEVPGRLPGAKPGGATETVDVDFSDSLAMGLGALADREGVSPFQLLVALLDVLFHRLTGAEDIVLGTPSSERRSPDVQNMVGLFVNTLVLRSRVTPTATFAEVLKSARSSVGVALDNGGIPFDALIDDLRVRRDPDRLPLVSVLCAAHDDHGATALQFEGIDVEPISVPPGGAGAVADLLVQCARSADGRIAVDFRFDHGVLDPWVVRQMVKALEVLAGAVVEDPNGVVGGLPIVESSEEIWLATGLNQNDRPFPDTTRVDTTFAHVASAHSGAMAVVDARRGLTYGELEAEVAAFASILEGCGAKPGTTVGIRLDRSVELAVALLAVARAGAVYVPIDAHSPETRSEGILDQAGVAIVVTLGDDATLRVEPTGRQATELPAPADEHAAYVMFTSGSTGQPKGAVISHRAIQRTVQNIDYTNLGPGEVVAMASNPAFDALTFEVWGALLTGARLEVVDVDTLTRPSEFAAWLRDRGVTTMFLTTSLANLTVAAEPDAFCTLDTLIVGGEAVDVRTMRSLVENGPRRLVNGYGPTECTTFSVWHEVTEVPVGAVSVPIGGPTSNTQLYVLDAAGALVANGFDGELCIAGPGLAMGYVGDPDLTASRFVEVQICGETIRVYRTGDLVRRDAEGVISYVGRRDHQIKLRGFRIELGEVEAALSADPAVVRAAVLDVGQGSQRRLVGYVVGVSDEPLDLADIRRELTERIPAYMVPSQFMELDAIPLTESGKIDRLALPEPVARPASITDEPTDDVERVVLAMWSEALQSTELGLDSDFFDAGGNSLLGVEALAALEGHFEIDLRLSALLDARTPRQFAALIRNEAAGGKQAALEHVVALRRGDPDSVPLWLIHPAGGSLVLYEPMANHLAPHRRILGVEASGLDGSSQPLSSVEGLADHQLATITTVQPHGPYRIVGYSIGGIVGLEVARRLMARGERVELLGAIEAGVPTGPEVLQSRLKRYGALLKRGDIAGMMRELKGSLHERRKVGEQRRQIARNQLDRAHKAVLDNMVHAFQHFEPTPLALNMMLFFGDDTSGETVERLHNQWSALATAGVVVRHISGSHDDDTVLREPHAPVLAAAIEQALDACDRNAWS